MLFINQLKHERTRQDNIKLVKPILNRSVEVQSSQLVVVVVNKIIVVLSQVQLITVVTSQALSTSALRCRHHGRCNCSHKLNSSIVAETVGVFEVTVDIAHRRSAIDASSSLRHRHRRYHHHHYYHHSRCRNRCIITDIEVVDIPLPTSPSS